MIYNNADWMGIPLEIIIKAYTKQLGDTSFTTLEAYRDDFLKFIKNNFNHFITNEQIQDIIEIRLHLVLDVITELFEAKLNDEIDELQNDNKTFNIKDVKQKVFFEVIDYISQIKDEILPEFENYKIEEFKLEYKSVIDKILPGFFIHNKIDKTQKIVNRIYKRLYHEFICIFSDDEDFTGIVIAGYGSDEIFPSISEIKIGEIISNKLRYEIKPIESIDNNNITAIISPFAQRDVVDTFIRGINVKSQNAIFDRMVNKIYEACDKISIKNSIDIKILLDEIMPVIDDVFEFIWYYNSAPRKKKDFGKRHDTIFRYSKTDNYYFNDNSKYIRQEYSPTAPRGYEKEKYYNPNGKVLDDVWKIPMLGQNDKTERVGYSTQKPKALLYPIIDSSCPPSGVVADFFCGSGTTLVVAKELGRNYVGCDINPRAVEISNERLI